MVTDVMPDRLTFAVEPVKPRPAGERRYIMADKHKTPETDPTRSAWLAAARPAAERAIGQLWQPTYRFAVLGDGPRRVDRKGRLAPNAGPETRQARVNAFYDLQDRLCHGLASGAMTVADARAAVARSEFAGQLHVAGSPAEAVEQFAELLVKGNNASAESSVGDVGLVIALWRD